MTASLNDVDDLDDNDPHGMIGIMTMAGNDENSPSVAELARFMQDFRNEFRTAMDSMVRKDVYAANMATNEAKMVAQDAEIKRIDTELRTDRTERRNLRSGMFINTAGIILTFVLTVVLTLTVS